MRLDGKRVLVVGGSSGIGLAVARRVLDVGGQAILMSRSADKLAAANATLGDRAETVACDAADERAVGAAVQTMGSLDHGVTTAAELTFAPFAEQPTAAIRKAVDTKLWAAIFVVRAALPRLARMGSITFFSGAAAYRPSPGAVVVAMVNAGLEGLAKGLAVELAPIRVNVISPGVVDTAVWDAMPAAARQRFFKDVATRLPARRIGTVEDLAEAALFAMTNGFVTGTVLHVDGGARLA